MKRTIITALALTMISLSPAAAMGPIPDVPTFWPPEYSSTSAPIVSRNAMADLDVTPKADNRK